MTSRVVPERPVVSVVILVFIVLAGVGSGLVAEQRALAAEEEFVAHQLREQPCLSDWGANEGAASKRVSITGVSPGGVRVAVSMPYAYTVERESEPIFADSASEAVYVVGPTTTRRVRGDDISIC